MAMQEPLSGRGRLALTLALVAGALAAAVRTEGAEGEGLQLFREKVEPVLKAQCFGCHSAATDKVKGGLRLDSREALLAGGDTGPALVLGNPEESLLIQAIQHQDGLEMPPKQPKLSDIVVADFVTWIKLGAPTPGDTAPPAASGNAKLNEARKHWAFVPVARVAVPSVEVPNWVRTPVDAFVSAKLAEKGWRPAPAAERDEWIRRVTFDLTGLPPSPDEVAAFLADPSPTAEESVVDRLLNSAHYGERWAQLWLDVVRFAESEGYEYDRHIPDAWRYRDYVINALNNDKPFDRFIVEQIAGDELEPTNAEFQTASTFHRLGAVRRNAGNADIALSRNEVLTERTDILGTAFLGLSIGCARCHNHKLEPISQKDYYRIQAYLAATDEHDVVLASEKEQKALKDRVEQSKADLVKMKQQLKRAAGEEKTRLEARIKDLQEQEPPHLPTIPGIQNDFPKRTPIHVLKRGAWENKGEPVGLRPLSVLIPDSEPELPGDAPAPRTKLARWLASPEHPLTARVLVNRIWQGHFGAGLVKTVNDFGTKGERPSHPELLDWLAATFVENGWRLKPLHRLIVLSSTYRQSSQSPLASEASSVDPENRLLWHFSRRRLSAEEIRDAMLAVSGRINPAVGGPSVMVPVDAELIQLLYKPAQWVVAEDRTQHDRRSIYLMTKRNLRLPFFEIFDAPALMTSCGRRESSTHPPQALEMMNGRISNDLAEAFAERLQGESRGVPHRIVDRAFELALGRPPTLAERTLSLRYLRDQTLKEFALAVFNLNGFLYVL